MYDTIVIGDDFSSLIAAVISARYGKKTILLSKNDIPDNYIESGYVFNVDPMPLTGFGPDQVYHRFLAEFGITPANDANLHLMNPALQIIFPAHRIELFNEIEGLVGEIERELCDEAIELRDYYPSLLKMSDLIDAWVRENPHIRPKCYNHFIKLIKMIPAILKLRPSLCKMFRILKENPSLKKIFEVEIKLLSNLHSDGNRFLSLMSPYLLSLPHRGLYYYSGGNGSLINALKERFATFGGVITEIESVTEILTSDEIDIDTNTCGQISKIIGRNLIISTKSEIFQLLLINKKFRRLKRLLKHVEPYSHPFTLHMGILGKGIPEKMASYVVIMLEEYNAIIDNNIIFVELSAPDDISRAPAGKRALSATVFLKHSQMKLSNFELEKISETIISQLETFLPFLRENLDYLNVGASIDISKKCLGVVNQKYLIKTNSFFGITALSHRTPLKNVFLTGGMLLAEFGFEGEFISGMNAAISTIK
jgi:phytoene dehydrogenase-like protein